VKEVILKKEKDSELNTEDIELKINELIDVLYARE
jgi:hypothetical protein